MTNLVRAFALTLATLTLSVGFANTGSAVDFGGIGGMGIPPIQGLPNGGGSGQDSRPSGLPIMTMGNGSGGSQAGNGGTSGGGAPVPAAQHAIKLACIVGGTLVEFPNDIWITNTTNATLVKGTTLAFFIASIGVKGSFLLPSNVPAGQQLRIADIFGGAPAGSPCTVKLS